MSIDNSEFREVCVLGLGYIGLPTASTLATRGLQVTGVDIDNTVVELLNEGKSHFSEPDLDMLLEAAVTTGKLKAATAPGQADAHLIAVPTPFNEDKTPNLSFVEAASRAVAKVLRKGDLIILESTSPVGTTLQIRNWIEEERPEMKSPDDKSPGDYFLAYCPERILPGRMVFELIENDRIIGGVSEECSERAVALYKHFVRGELHRTRASVAEFVKLAENGYRDVNIAFANELSIICNALQLNVWEAISLANRHPRVDILNPGPGVGGHCIAIDPWFLISQHSDRTPLMRSARTVNDSKPTIVLQDIRRQIERFKKPTVACLGLTYKANIDDLRESPALLIVEHLARENVNLIVVEPNIKALPQQLADRENVSAKDFDQAIREADIVALLVGHSAFAAAPRDILLSRVVVDAVGLWHA